MKGKSVRQCLAAIDKLAAEQKEQERMMTADPLAAIRQILKYSDTPEETMTMLRKIQEHRDVLISDEVAAREEASARRAERRRRDKEDVKAKGRTFTEDVQPVDSTADEDNSGADQRIGNNYQINS